MPGLRGRPALTCHVVQIRLTLSLWEDRDQDLIRFFEGVPDRKRAIAVKSALRSGGMLIETDEDSREEDVENFDDFLFG